MASTSSSSNNIHHTRSSSLTSGSHPSTLQVEDAISKLKTREASVSTSTVPTADAICRGLVSLQGLYDRVDDLLGLPSTQQALTQSQYTKFSNELLDQSISLLDVCGSLRDLLSEVRENVRDVQSALRRRKEDVRISISFIKKLKKDSRKAIASLKHIDDKIGGMPMLDHDLSSVSRVLREVIVVSTSVFRSLSLFLSGSVANSKTARWSVVSYLIHKETVEYKDQLQVFLECQTEEIENGLECMFRRLIKTRSSLLNILSNY
ncbi:hypothetical protein OSB04_000547 [Centaurea solstitialis]|uniref:Uncharacterized protein n=1 Tax=Centaurea solstitialis TaxID=347529 RepID=A0AA38TZU4_9ASTR|nr:hypothetical protein OSB04_000547 [Centaurea solstitialis]